MTSAEEELKQALASLSALSDLKTAAEDSDSPTDKAAALRLLSASTPLFSALKRANRRIYTDLQAQKARVADERARVDTARLALQNLKYEEAMLELEVKVCQEFQSIYQDIELHPLDEFHALRTSQRQATEDDENTQTTMEAEDIEGDDHKLMLARLRFELQERKRLEEEKQRLQQDKTQVAKDNKDKKVKLEQAEKQLKDLLAAAQAVHAKFESF